METRCGLLRWKRRREEEEKKQPCTRLQDTSFAGDVWGEEEANGDLEILLLVVSRIQTGTVHIYLDVGRNVPTILPRPAAKQGGFLADTAGSGRG